MARRKKNIQIFRYECQMTGDVYKTTKKADNPDDLMSVNAYYDMNPEEDDRPEDIKKELAGNQCDEMEIEKRKEQEPLFVDTAFFGDGAVNIRGKGHRGYSKKGVIRACASSIFPGRKRVRACVFNEAYTSSRCPACKCCTKMKTEGGGGREDKEEEREREDENESQPDHGKPSDSETQTTITTSPTLETDSKTEENDTRKEVCECCGKIWPHDVVSIVNMLHIVSCNLKGKDHPSWLGPEKKMSSRKK